MPQLVPILLIVSMLAVVSCASEASRRTAQPSAAQTTLYDRLGGKEAITKVVDALVARVGADTRINGYFASTDIPRLKRHMVDQICQATGGPCTYTGRSMRETHRGMGVSDAAFNAIVEALVATLNEFEVPTREKSELLALLGPMRQDIVESK